MTKYDDQQSGISINAALERLLDALAECGFDDHNVDQFQRDKARRLIQDYMDHRAVGHG